MMDSIHLFYDVKIKKQTKTGVKIMRELTKFIVDWIPERYPVTNEVYKFFDADGRLNTLARPVYNDGTIGKVTVKNEVDSRVIGSQNSDGIKTVQFLYNGTFNKGVYSNSHTSKGALSIRTGMHGQSGIGGGAYVYWIIEGDGRRYIHRQAYYLNIRFPRYVADEIVGYYDSKNQLHYYAMIENVEKRKERSDKGKTHNTMGKITKMNEIVSENKRKIKAEKKASKRK